MKITISSIALLVFVACGGEITVEPPLISPGIYDVTATIIESDWGLAPGREMDGQFDIGKKNDQYTLGMVGQSWEATGEIIDGEVVLNHRQDYEDLAEGCDDFNHINIVLRPDGSNRLIEGEWNSELHLCSLTNCLVPLPIPECEPFEASILEKMGLIGEKVSW